VVINTKMGHVFVLNRLTGAPLLPVEERPVPQTDIPGEQSSPKQPFSTISLVPETISPANAWGPKPEDVKWCQEKIKASRWEGVFTPPSLQGTLIVPGNVGGVNWGSAAYDPERHIMVANTNRLMAWVKMIPRERYDARKPTRSRTIASTANSASNPGRPSPSIAPLFFRPAVCPATPPPWGTTEAVDLYTSRPVRSISAVR
jgi:quinoprotein glucose dehydrogenase